VAVTSASSEPGPRGLGASPVALGTWQLSGHWGDFDENTAEAAIRRARELGVTVFDTAHFYGWGRSEEILGRALAEDLRAHREDVVIVTKAGLRFDEEHGPYPDASPDWLREGIESSLRSLGVDHLDIFLVHAPDPRIPFEQTAAFLQGYVERGLIGQVGLSNFNAAQTAEFASAMPVTVVESPYNLFQRKIEKDLVPLAERQDLTVLTYSPLANGLLSGALRPDTVFGAGDWRSEVPMFQGQGYHRTLSMVAALSDFARERFGVPVARLAIAWVLARPWVGNVIVGARSPAHVEEAVAATGLSLGPADVRAVEDVLRSAFPGART
jgi:aryl-alcohol dehydrogenase-like predicted oxidoreductase